MHYAKEDAEHVVPLLPGDAVFSGYLRNFVKNDGDEDFVIVYAISPKNRYEQ